MGAVGTLTPPPLSPDNLRELFAPGAGPRLRVLRRLSFLAFTVRAVGRLKVFQVYLISFPHASLVAKASAILRRQSVAPRFTSFTKLLSPSGSRSRAHDRTRRCQRGADRTCAADRARHRRPESRFSANVFRSFHRKLLGYGSYPAFFLPHNCSGAGSNSAAALLASCSARNFAQYACERRVASGSSGRGPRSIMARQVRSRRPPGLEAGISDTSEISLRLPIDLRRHSANVCVTHVFSLHPSRSHEAETHPFPP
jgi:hypothetical protein